MKANFYTYAFQNFKNALKLNGIFTFLIIFFMTVSSYGQIPGQLTGQYGIEFVFSCPVISIESVTVKFPAPDISGTNYVYPEGTAYDTSDPEAEPTIIENEWFVDYDGNKWILKGPSSTGGTAEYFYGSSVAAFPSNDAENDWDDSTAGQGFACGSILNIIYTALESDPDIDQDTFPASIDCDDNPSDDPEGGPFAIDINPGTSEVPGDLTDNDCDGDVDEDDDDTDMPTFCDEAETKVLICHKGKDKCVQINAVDAHIAHGDTYGSCTPASGSQANFVTIQEFTEVNPTTIDVVYWPNPSNNVFNVKMITPNFEDKVDIKVFDINGRLVHANVIRGNEDYQFGNNLSHGVYFVKISQTYNYKVMKVVKN